MIALDDIYQQLATERTHDQLAAHYRAAQGHGPLPAERIGPELTRPIAALATAVPPSATAGTAIHMLHALPSNIAGDLPEQLVEIARRNVADALRHCHRALELDGADHSYTVAEWLPTVYDIAGALLRSARLDADPPTIVQAAQEAISWLSRAIADLDESSPEAPTSLAETLARLLVVWTFTDAALPHRQPVVAASIDFAPPRSRPPTARERADRSKPPAHRARCARRRPRAPRRGRPPPRRDTTSAGDDRSHLACASTRPS